MKIRFIFIRKLIFLLLLASIAFYFPQFFAQNKSTGEQREMKDSVVEHATLAARQNVSTKMMEAEAKLWLGSHVTVAEMQQQRQQHLTNVCSTHRRQKHVSRDTLFSIFTIDKIRTLYCVLGKVASTSWMQVLAMATGKLNSTTDPRQLDWIHNGHMSAKYLRRLSTYPTQAVNERLNTYYKFVFVRHPFDRLVSAFREKFTQNVRYKHRVGSRIINKYRTDSASHQSAIQFDEFVQFLLDQRRRRQPLDRHWRPQYELCRPCDVHYDFIGHYETLYDDAEVVLKRIGVATNIFPRDVDRWRHAARRRNETMANISSDLVDKLRQMYAGDFDLFGY